jgi:hypothetical protein
MDVRTWRGELLLRFMISTYLWRATSRISQSTRLASNIAWKQSRLHAKFNVVAFLERRAIVALHD